MLAAAVLMVCAQLEAMPGARLCYVARGSKAQQQQQRDNPASSPVSFLGARGMAEKKLFVAALR